MTGYLDLPGQRVYVEECGSGGRAAALLAATGRAAAGEILGDPLVAGDAQGPDIG